MKRALRPVRVTARARYPRLAMAWRFLVGATLGAGPALADATVPPPVTHDGAKSDAPSNDGAKSDAPSNGNNGGAKSDGAKKPPSYPHHYAGKRSSAQIDRRTVELILHPHAPDQPCDRGSDGKERA